MKKIGLRFKVKGERKNAKGKAKIKSVPPSALRPLTSDLGPCFSRRRRQCPDCFYCQGCSQDRCRLCRSPRKPTPKKLSLAEQIAWYERINKKDSRRKK